MRECAGGSSRRVHASSVWSVRFVRAALLPPWRTEHPVHETDHAPAIESCLPIWWFSCMRGTRICLEQQVICYVASRR